MTKYFDTWEETQEYQAKNGGVTWRHDAGHYAVTASHSHADELPESEKWTEREARDTRAE